MMLSTPYPKLITYQFQTFTTMANVSPLYAMSTSISVPNYYSQAENTFYNQFTYFIIHCIRQREDPMFLFPGVVHIINQQL